MQKLIIDEQWTEITTPCLIQVTNNARLAIFTSIENSVPDNSSPYFIIHTTDMWEQTSSNRLFVKTLDNDYECTIVVTNI